MLTNVSRASIALFLSLFLTQSPYASGEWEVIIDVIKAQISAFENDDGEAAYAYAAPVVKRYFPDAESFMQMVRNGYRPVYRPKSFEFMDQVEYSTYRFQVVRIVGPDGVVWNAYYAMEKQADGRWLIAAVELRLPFDVKA